MSSSAENAVRDTDLLRTEHGLRATLAWRIWRPVWADEQTFGRLVEAMCRFPEAVDEVALFDDHIHFPGKPAGEVRRTAEIVRVRMGVLRSVGLPGVGVNVIATLGHGMQAGFREMPFPPTVGNEGQVSTSCPCPNRPEFRRWVQDYYRAMAEAGPDFIWVDDDLRSVAHGVRYPCFCDFCIHAFGHEGDRESLVTALSEPGNGRLRKAWSEFCGANLVSLLREIRQAIEGVDPRIEIGLMTIGYSQSTYGYPIRLLMQAAGAVRGRPGHGYYTDREPRSILKKVLDVARQVRDYPDKVTNIQYELENWPYITLDKSVRTVLNECTLSVMAGCTGVAFNAVSERATRFEEYEPLWKAASAHRAVWDGLADAAQGLPVVGFWPADHPNLMALRRVTDGDWFQEPEAYDIQQPNEMAQMGLPLTADRRSACGVLLAGRIAETFTDDELRDMLGGAVLMDGQALEVLWERGLGELTGVRPGRRTPPCFERLTEHELNGPFGGDGRRVMPSSRAVALEAADGVGELSHAVAQADETDFGMCLSAFENELGGRVAVSTYVPWTHLGRAGKRHQLIVLADWLCRGNLPAIIEQTCRVAPLARVSPDGECVVLTLFNMSFDPTGPLTVRLLARPCGMALLTPSGRVPVETRSERGGTLLAVPTLDPWQIAVLVGPEPAAVQ